MGLNQRSLGCSKDDAQERMPASGHRTRSPDSLQLKLQADSAQTTSSQRSICEHCFWQRPVPRQQCFLLTEHPGTSIHPVSASSQSARAGPTRKREESHVDGHHPPPAQLSASHPPWRPSRHCDAQPGHAALRKTGKREKQDCKSSKRRPEDVTSRREKTIP
ncbi:uncharacterized protein AAG666_017528 [Megaptera novaeangliae]